MEVVSILNDDDIFGWAIVIIFTLNGVYISGGMEWNLAKTYTELFEPFDLLRWIVLAIIAIALEVIELGIIGFVFGGFANSNNKT